MRLANSLLLPFLGTTLLGTTMIRETSAAMIKPAGDAAIVKGDNQFAVDLYAQLDREQPGKNLFFSPTSISVALAMTTAGARGQTQSEMADVLHLGADWRRPMPIITSFWTNGMRRARSGPTSSAWPIDCGAKRAIRSSRSSWPSPRQQYGAEMASLDFAQAAAASREINQWVEQQTNNKIKDLIPASAIGPLTRLVLTNAVYFKGDWRISSISKARGTRIFRSRPSSRSKRR